MTKRFGSASCCTGETLFEGLQVEYDEDGAHALLEVRPCADLICGKPLRAGCDQFRCDGCGGTFGADQRVWIADETDQPLHCCESCAYESKPVCPCCDEHAHMRPRENDIERWYECEACGAKLDEAEITAVNQEPIPAYLLRHELVRQATTMAELMEVVRVHEASGCPCAAMNEVVTPVRAQGETRTATPRLVA